MRWALDQPVRVGEVVCVPIVETLVSVTQGQRSLAAHCEKRPSLFLLFQAGDVRGFDLSGKRYDADAIEQSYPDAIRRARARLGAQGV